jgi:hypothetical protein
VSFHFLLSNIELILQARVTGNYCWDCLLGHCYYISTFQLRTGFHCMFMSRSYRSLHSRNMSYALKHVFADVCSGLLNITLH